MLWRIRTVHATTVDSKIFQAHQPSFPMTIVVVYTNDGMNDGIMTIDPLEVCTCACHLNDLVVYKGIHVTAPGRV